MRELAIDEASGELHQRHHVTKQGYYRGRQLINVKQHVDEDDE